MSERDSGEVVTGCYRRVMSEEAPVTGSRRGPYRSGQARRREIIDAATEVFAVEGYRGGSLREVARALDMSPGLITHHFGSKEQLLVAVLEEKDLSSKLGVERDPTPGHFAASLVEIVAMNEKRPGLLRLFTTLAAEAVNPDHPAHEFFARRYERLIQYLAERLEAEAALGTWRATTPATEFASMVLAAMDGLQTQWLLSQDFPMSARFASMLRALGLDPC